MHQRIGLATRILRPDLLEFPPMQQLPAAAATFAITGSNLSGTDLVAEIGDRPTLLVFLRHLG